MNVDERAVCLELVESARRVADDPQRLLALLQEIDGLLSRAQPEPVRSLERARPTDELLIRLRNALDDRDDRKARRTVGYMLTYLTHESEEQQ